MKDLPLLYYKEFTSLPEILEELRKFNYFIERHKEEINNGGLANRYSEQQAIILSAYFSKIKLYVEFIEKHF